MIVERCLRSTICPCPRNTSASISRKAGGHIRLRSRSPRAIYLPGARGGSGRARRTPAPLFNIRRCVINGARATESASTLARIARDLRARPCPVETRRTSTRFPISYPARGLTHRGRSANRVSRSRRIYGRTTGSSRNETSIVVISLIRGGVRADRRRRQ